MYEFWYDYVKSKYGKKAKLCYLDTDNFIIYIKKHGIDKDIAEAVETRFDTSKRKKQSNYLIGKKINYGSEDKKNKRHKKVYHKKKT